MLCEVALGKMRLLYEATQVIDLPNKKHQSVMGCGKFTPNMSKSIYLSNGTMVPLGPIIQAKNVKLNQWGYASLQHNEYVVYDTTQVRVKYILELRDQ